MTDFLEQLVKYFLINKNLEYLGEYKYIMIVLYK